MSISSTARKAGPYNGNGIAVAFPFAFKVFSSADVMVVKTTPAAVESTLVLTTDYTVSLNADQDSNPGGTVTVVSAPASGYKITISSQVAELQPVVLTNAGGFYPKVINDALDRLTILAQQLAEKVERAVKVDISSLLTPDDFLQDLATAAVDAEASALAAAASALAAEESAASIDTSNFVQKANNLSDVASATAARANLGLVIGANVLAPNGDGSGLTGISANKIQPIDASVAANALTITLSPTTLDFRSSSLSSGTVNTRTVGTAISLVVPSTATLGTINSVQNRLAVLAIDNAGTVELAVVNIAGGNDLSETGLISTTALSAASDSNAVIYSTTARTSVPYRVVGYVESTQATAGTWATAPSTIQGQGGQALAAMSSLGYGQTWQSVTGSRVSGTTYYNTTGKPISVLVGPSASGSTSATVIVGGATIIAVPSVSGVPPIIGPFVVSPGSSYSVTYAGAASIASWYELR